MDASNLSSNLITEKEFQNKIYNSNEIKNNILSVLNIDQDCIFEKEVEFINGITSDFILYDRNSNKMKAIIECKRADIGVTEYVRGVGQLFQYEYFQEESICPKRFSNIKYDLDDNNNILIIPSDFIKNTKLNIGRFKYPVNSKILEIHIRNNRVRHISSEELYRLSLATNDSIITISQYYIRDIRIFECYIALKVLSILGQLSVSINRKELEVQILRKIKVINNRNWRNAFITLSSLGFLGDNLKIYNSALSLVGLKIESFINTVYKDYLYTFIDLIMDILSEKSDDNGYINISNKELGDIIVNNYNNRDILFLTDSNYRYISSWLNIMRDDLGCIYFEARQKLRKINYIPKELDDVNRIINISKYSKANRYIEEYELSINKIVRDFL